MVSFFQEKAIAFMEAQSALGMQGREDLTGPLDGTLHTQNHLARDWGEGHSIQKKSHEQQCKDEACTRICILSKQIRLAQMKKFTFLSNASIFFNPYT